MRQAQPELTSQRFRFEFAPSYRLPALLFGVRDATAPVEVLASDVVARFGPWTVRTALSNIVSTEFTGPFAYPKTASPAHLSLTDQGLTFATTSRQGLLIRFARPVSGLDPWRLLRHCTLTVTVVHRNALATALQPTLGVNR